MKKILLAAAVLPALYFGADRAALLRPGSEAIQESARPADSKAPAELLAAIRSQRRGAQVTGEGRVTQLLPDDNDGSRHQRFILTLATGHTLLVAHNIDLAPRIASLKTGDAVAFHGVFEWNPKGGVIHWTHHDPEGRHEPGWLKHAGQTYQ